MKSVLALSLAAACALSTLAVPQYAAAVDRDYGRGDICAAKQKEATTTGTIAGGALGALAGAAIAGKHDRTAGAIVGARRLFGRRASQNLVHQHVSVET